MENFIMENNKSIKVLFLVMYSGEGDYDRCIEAAKNQIGIEPHFYEVKHQPLMNAHYEIYSYWNDHKDEYDMFVKLDADFVLYNNTKVIDVYNAMSKTNLAVLCVWADDFLRKRLIPGMIFGNKHCTFNVNNVINGEKAVYDTGMYVIAEGYRFDDLSIAQSLAPSALHGHYSYPIQLFAQGVKRRLRRGGQWDIHQIVQHEFNNNPDKLRFMFLIGWALAETVLSDDYNYTDEKFNDYFNKVNELVNTTDHGYKISNILNNL
jgi:hypothetical protein